MSQPEPAAGTPQISVVIPALNEAPTLEELAGVLRDVLEPIDPRFELVFVDDGSTDGSFEILRRLHREDARVRALRFGINYGKAAALSAGFAAARAPIVFTIDADLQDDPLEIPRFLEKLAEGYDLVSGWKQQRRDPRARAWASWLFNGVVARASGIRLHDFNCGFKCYRRPVLDRIDIYGEMHRFVPLLAGWHGFRIAELPVRHHPRKIGRSRYGPERLWRGLLDFFTVIFLTRYGKRPLHLFGGLALALGGLGAAALLAAVAARVAHPNASSHVSLGLFLLGSLLALGGIQLIATGLAAEMVTYLYRKGEPGFHVEDRLD